jgi:Raf kinase inhibitor-like YbhB/YbcL family protein
MGRLTTLLLCVASACLLLFDAASGEGPMRIGSPAFADNGKIPKQYTCDGQDVSPPLTIENPPADTVSFAMIMDDPDAPGGTWVHWVLWNFDPATREISAGTVPKGAVQGINDFKKKTYGGPCPPSGTHRYFFKLYALSALLTLSPGSTKGDLEKAMKDHVLAKAELVGRFR